MRIYVAGSSAELPRVRAVMAALVRGGHAITLDWTLSIDRAAEGAGDSRATCALADDAAIRAADVVLVLAPLSATTWSDCWVELGIALGERTRIVVSGPPRSIFCELAEARSDSDVEAVAYLGSGEERGE